MANRERQQADVSVQQQMVQALQAIQQQSLQGADAGQLAQALAQIEALKQQLAARDESSQGVRSDTLTPGAARVPRRGQ